MGPTIFVHPFVLRNRMQFKEEPVFIFQNDRQLPLLNKEEFKIYNYFFNPVGARNRVLIT